MPISIKGRGETEAAAKSLQEEYERAAAELEKARPKGPRDDYDYGYCDGMKDAVAAVEDELDAVEGWMFFGDEERENREWGLNAAAGSIKEAMKRKKCP